MQFNLPNLGALLFECTFNFYIFLIYFWHERHFDYLFGEKIQAPRILTKEWKLCISGIDREIFSKFVSVVLEKIVKAFLKLHSLHLRLCIFTTQVQLKDNFEFWNQFGISNHKYKPDTLNWTFSLNFTRQNREFDFFLMLNIPLKIIWANLLLSTTFSSLAVWNLFMMILAKLWLFTLQMRVETRYLT